MELKICSFQGDLSRYQCYFMLAIDIVMHNAGKGFFGDM